MANQEHLDILKQGVEVWNEWRRNNPKVQPNLSHHYLSRANLSKASLTKANLRGADLTKANLSRADLKEALQLHF